MQEQRNRTSAQYINPGLVDRSVSFGGIARTFGIYKKEYAIDTQTQFWLRRLVSWLNCVANECSVFR
jgi:hypothetical protein